MESETLAPLTPYTSEQITKGEIKLPERLSSITNDVEAGERLKLDSVLKNIVDSSKTISTKTDSKFVVLGSMGMYATLNELRENGQQLMLLEQRIAQGKNDYDMGTHPDETQKVMSSFGWDESIKKDQHGTIEKGGPTIDVLSRREFPHFPWRQTEVDGQKIFAQAPEEMIFEKMDALINPSENRGGEPRIREVKWGVDIKLLKTYLTMKNNWSESEVEKHLSDRWGEYVDDKRYEEVPELSERVANGESVNQVVIDSLKKRLGKDQIADARQELINILGQRAEANIQSLLSSSNEEEFTANLKGLFDLLLGPKLSYEQASQKASQEYAKLLEGSPNNKYV